MLGKQHCETCATKINPSAQLRFQWELVTEGWTCCWHCASGIVNAWNSVPLVLLQMYAQLSCEPALTRVLAVGVTQEVTAAAQEVTTAAQEADAAVPAVAEVLGATQGAGAASFPQENSGEDTQVLTAPSATQVLVTAAASSAASPVDAEGRILPQGLLST